MPHFEHDGASIHYEEHGTGEPVLLMHGFTESAEALSELIDGLAPHYRVIAPDLRGYGSSRPLPRDYTADHYQRDARDMAALLRHLGVERAHVAGFSDGAEVSLLVALESPELARAVVAWGVAGKLGDIDAEVEEIHNLADNPSESRRGWSEEIREVYGVEVARAMTRGWASAARAIIAAGGDISLSQAHEIRCPVLIVNGEEDQANPVPVVRELAARIPDAELILVPGVGHAVHLERPEWFLRTVLDWLAQR